MQASLYRPGISAGTLLQLFSELFCIFVAVVLAFWFHGHSRLAMESITPACLFAVLMVALNGVLGLYRDSSRLTFGAYSGRLFLALLIGAPIAYLASDLVPGGDRFQSTLGQAVLLAFGGLILVRHAVVTPLLRAFLPHRVIVIGTGHEAELIQEALRRQGSAEMQLVGFYPLAKLPECAVNPASVIEGGQPIDQVVKTLRISEIVVAVREQRGGVLPLRALLECRLAGIPVTDLARFYERVRGQIPIESLKASWLIYGAGFRQGWLRTTVKRLFDIVVAMMLLLCAIPILAVAATLIAVESGFPVIYRQERVGLRGRTFQILKLRSMRKDAEKDGQPTWASVNDSRVTSLGRFLRRTRIDELPQLFNVLRGEMSFVGPRPERPTFVEMLTERIPFYAVRQSVKPGLTGWAQVRYSYGGNIEDATNKLEYDLYYVKNHTLFLDIRILLETVRVVILGEGAR